MVAENKVPQVLEGGAAADREAGRRNRRRQATDTGGEPMCRVRNATALSHQPFFLRRDHDLDLAYLHPDIAHR
jgi:hypothetical protein